ncbi:hypothetical protein LOTGIDRAFT_237815 [Lottia gigantea]|uniref:Ricin B lectin domain-containing protein n=1 Tax=Lottia gigantea TaxID=225164 RepID=V4AZQ7_LOTGI|nr:hypothetical protein LOTGIDRAFT_237815 [Lottia gigantea]ESP03208.1 hypothetical protein LOTGIDRAFT_237815 [Lottia gigantea]
MGSNQLWYHCKFGQIRRHRGCFEPHKEKQGQITSWYCTGEYSEKQHWLYRDDQSIYHGETKQCLDVVSEGKRTYRLVLNNCNNQPSQQWRWLRSSPPGPIPQIN